MNQFVVIIAYYSTYYIPIHEINDLLTCYIFVANTYIPFIVTEIIKTLYSRKLKEWVQEQLESNPLICVSEDVQKLQYFLHLCQSTEKDKVGIFYELI